MFLCYACAMQVYKSRYSKLPGTTYTEIVKLARRHYHKIQKQTPRRQTYVRSKYFTKDKIFINEFWKHLEQKDWGDRARRIKLFPCGIDLIRNTTFSPVVVVEAQRPRELLYRFTGMTNEGEMFLVQIKENQRSNRKDLMSIFPIKGQGN